MNRHRRNQNNIVANLKDYAVPIIWLLFLILIIWSVLWWWGNWSTDWTAQSSWTDSVSYQVSFSQPDTVAQVTYSWWRREEINDNAELFWSETITVQEWRVRLSPEANHSIHLNRIAEFKIDWPGRYALFSSDAWIDTESPVSITMRYATVTSWTDTIMSLTQNEAGSTIYMLQWSAQVENMVWVQTTVVAGQRISVPRLQASNRDFDITSERVPLDTFFRNSDWFLENDWHLIEISTTTENNDDEENLSDENEAGTWASTNLIRFDRLRDEMSIDSSSINVSGTLLSDNIGAISIQNIPVEIDVSSRSFALDNVTLPLAMNDLVVKIYDSERDILSKEVFTVYTSSPSESQEWSSSGGSTSNDSQASTNNSTTTSSATHFDVDATQFSFTSPSNTGRFTTTSPEVTIRWETTADNVDRVEVNGFTLNSFNWRTWRYHAFERFDTIRDWTNQYRIDYYDSNGEIIFTDFFTIIKQAPWAIPPTSSQNNSTQDTNNETRDSEPEEAETSDESEVLEEPESLFWE